MGASILNFMFCSFCLLKVILHIAYITFNQQMIYLWATQTLWLGVCGANSGHPFDKIQYVAIYLYFFIIFCGLLTEKE